MRKPFLELAFTLACACGASPATPSEDAGAEASIGHKTFDAAADVAEAAPPPKVPFDRMQPHAGVVLQAPRIAAIYVDYPEYDAFLSWIVTSTDYWSILAQYGVGYGTFVGSVSIATSTFFAPGDVTGGFADWSTVRTRTREAIHDAQTAVPAADAYVVFLGVVNVTLGTDKTCVSIGGYHTSDGLEPISVIPPCGRSLAISHELAEMATDPFETGWYSDADFANAGGEIGDLCNDMVPLDGWHVTQLWSNADGDCEPAQ